jgi:hypothetical protein
LADVRGCQAPERSGAHRGAEASTTGFDARSCTSGLYRRERALAYVAQSEACRNLRMVSGLDRLTSYELKLFMRQIAYGRLAWRKLRRVSRKTCSKGGRESI